MLIFIDFLCCYFVDFLPAPSHGRTEAVPVIRLNTDENGKASVDSYLNTFPQQLLAENKRVRPIERYFLLPSYI